MLNAGIVHDDVKPPNEELKTFSIISRISSVWDKFAVEYCASTPNSS
jgi:hypothetical protein